ncbi:ornithine carbamoyltransferase [Nesterenkonia marinintestina]|uniref:ornithine carbamoyltransferase n=1 Tax=Nesterenkonia marinintestina TaxID=2979865 RepID=UPI0021BF493D|nr:ornithine carbamoyltransferase [Nesterenkonia sp. GX14115]
MTVRHLLTDLDLTPGELTEVLDLADHLKAHPYAIEALAGPQTVVVIFDKTSTRTRVSFAAGISALGGSPLIINPGEAQLGHKESVADTAGVLGRMVSAVVWRTFAQSGLEDMARHSRVPVVNALSDDYHPCQLLADLQTVREHLGSLAGRSLAYLGDAGNNMAASYLLACANAGMDVRIAGPAGHLPDDDVVAAARERAADTGGSVLVTTEPARALDGAEAVATDTWISMGQEEGTVDRTSLFGDYRIDAEAMRRAAEDAIVLHCLPAYRGAEIAAEVIDGPQSVVFDEAENRLHAQKALLTWLLVESGLADAATADAVGAVCRRGHDR